MPEPIDIRPVNPYKKVPIDPSREIPLVGAVQRALSRRVGARALRSGASTFDRARSLQVTGDQGLVVGADNLRKLFFDEIVEAIPELDPETGAETGRTVLAYAFGNDFRLGGGRAPAQGAASLRRTTQNARLLQGLTLDQALNFLYSLDEDEMQMFQVQMKEAGFYGKDRFTWGVLDDETKTAFQRMMRRFADNPELTVDETLDRAVRGYTKTLQAEKDGDGSNSERLKKMQEQLLLLQPELTDPKVLDEVLDQAGVELIGRTLSPERKAQIIDNIRQKQKDEFYATTYRQAQIEIANNRPIDEIGSGGDIEAFMQAISGQESGGNPNAVNPDSGAAGMFQIMPSNWVPWAREAGVDPNDRSAANQMRVARHKMLEYYQMFGNWSDVAVAWYAGPGNAEARRAGRLSGDGSEGAYPTINEYARQAMERFDAIRKGGVSNTYQDPTLAVEFRDKLDVGAEARAILKAANPEEYAATQWGRQAKTFMSMLAGVV